MFHLQFMALGVSLVNAASDGQLSLDEVRDCIDSSFPKADDVVSAIEDAMEDGRITVMEVLDITSAIIS